MVQIIQEKRPQGFADRIMSGLADIAPGIAAGHQEAQASRQRSLAENDALKKITGQDFSGINDPKIRQDLIASKLRGDESSASDKRKYDFQAQENTAKNNIKQAEKDAEIQEKVGPLTNGLERINKMRALRAKDNLGRGSGITKFFGGETAKDFGEYEQLGKSLISLSTNIPIRNKLEFETLAHKLYDPTIQDEEAEGILDSMENIIRGSLSAYSNPKGSSQGGNATERPPLSSFNR